MDKKIKMRVWWMPQVGANATFYIPVKSVEEARKYMDILAAYDAFQYNHHIKPDYCNIGGLQVWDENEKDWCDWHGEGTNDCYDEVDDYIESHDDASEFEEFTRELLSQVTFD